MAKKLSEIYVDFTGRLGKLKSAMSKAKSLVSRGMKTLGNLAKRGAFALGAGLVAAVGLSIKAFISFEQQMAKVATMLSEQTMRLIPKYTRAIKDLAVRFGEGTASITEGLYNILSASIPAGKAIQFLMTSMKAAKAGFTNTSTVAYALTGIMNAYGYAAEKVGEVTDILFTIQKRGQTTVGQLAPIIGRVTGLAAALGVRFEEVAAAIATLTRAGISDAETITYLRGLLVSLTGRSKEGIKVAKQYGIELSAQALKTEQLSGMVRKFLSLSPDVIKTIMSETEARTALSVLITNMTGFEKDLTAEMNASGAMMEAYGKLTGTLSYKFGRLWQSIKMLAVDLGTTFAPMIKKAVDSLIAKLTGMRDTLAAVWYGSSGDFRKFLKVLSKIMSVKIVELAKAAYSFGALIADGLIKGIKDKWLRYRISKRGLHPFVMTQAEREKARRELAGVPGGLTEKEITKERRQYHRMLEMRKAMGISTPKEEIAGTLSRIEKNEKAMRDRVAAGQKNVTLARVKKELEANRQVADAKIDSILEESGIREGYEKYLEQLQKERAEREAGDAADREKDQEDEEKRLAASAARRQRESERLAEERKKLLEEEETKRKASLAAAAKTAEIGFAGFGAAWGNIVRQLTAKEGDVEERQLTKLEEIVQESKKFTFGLEDIRRAIEASDGGGFKE